MRKLNEVDIMLDIIVKNMVGIMHYFSLTVEEMSSKVLK